MSEIDEKVEQAEQKEEKIDTKPSLALLVEKYHPSVLGIVASGLIGYYVPVDTRKLISETLANPLLSLLAIFVGFLSTSLTILLTATESEGIKKIRSAVQFRYLIGYHTETIALGASASILALIVLVAKPDGQNWKSGLLFYPWLFFSIASIIGFFRLIFVLPAILMQGLPEPGKPIVPNEPEIS